jgi:hypothetical protein
MYNPSTIKVPLLFQKASFSSYERITVSHVKFGSHADPEFMVILLCKGPNVNYLNYTSV